MNPENNNPNNKLNSLDKQNFITIGNMTNEPRNFTPQICVKQSWDCDIGDIVIYVELVGNCKVVILLLAISKTEER
jgi:hypothetical protein